MYTVLVDNRWGDRCRNKDSMRIVPRVDEEDGTRLTGNFKKKGWNGRRSFDEFSAKIEKVLMDLFKSIKFV